MLNVGLEPTPTVWLVGWFVIASSATVRTATELVTEPPKLVTMTV